MKGLRFTIAGLAIIGLLSLILNFTSSILYVPWAIAWVANVVLCGILASKLGRRVFLWVIGAWLIQIIIPLILVFQKEVVKPVASQVLRVKASPSLDKPVVINKFRMDKAAVKTSSDLKSLAESLDNELVKEFTKKGYQVAESGNDYPTIDGSFVKVDEGNRLVRNIALWGGEAKIEVEGTFKEKGKVIKDFHIVDNGDVTFGIQVLEGSAQLKLTNATKNIAKQILKEFLPK